MNRRSLLMTGAAVLLTVIPHAKAEARRKPNFIVILCDDLGYGDIEPFGNRFFKTPNLMRMARGLGLGPDDSSSVLKVYEKILGKEVRL